MFDASPGTRQLWAAVQPELAGFRVEIVTGVAGATALPWEAMTGPGTGQQLALGAAAMVRAHPQAALAPRLPQDQVPVRVLLVISRPGVIDVPYRSVAHHLARLHETNSGSLAARRAAPADIRPADPGAAGGQGPRHARTRCCISTATGSGATPATRSGSQTVIPAAAGTGRAAGWRHRAAPAPTGTCCSKTPRWPATCSWLDGPALGNLLADTGVPLLILNACRSALAEPATRGRGGGG